MGGVSKNRFSKAKRERKVTKKGMVASRTVERVEMIPHERNGTRERNLRKRRIYGKMWRQKAREVRKKNSRSDTLTRTSKTEINVAGE